MLLDVQPHLQWQGFQAVRARAAPKMIVFVVAQYVSLHANSEPRLRRWISHHALLVAAGAVPQQVHRHGLLAALLQAHAEQEADPERSGVHRPRVLQLAHMDQVAPAVRLHERVGLFFCFFVFLFFFVMDARVFTPELRVPASKPKRS